MASWNTAYTLPDGSHGREKTLVSSSGPTLTTAYQLINDTNQKLDLNGSKFITVQYGITAGDGSGFTFQVHGRKGATSTYDRLPSTKTLSDGSALNTEMGEVASVTGNSLNIYTEGLKASDLKIKNTAGTTATLDYCHVIIHY